MITNEGKLTPEVHKKIVDYIKDGNYFKTAALASGIHDKTFSRWKTRGEALLERYGCIEDVPSDDADYIYATFATDVKIAFAQWEARKVSNINVAGDSRAQNSWTADATLLSRRIPERWNEKVAANNVNITINNISFDQALAGAKTWLQAVESQGVNVKEIANNQALLAAPTIDVIPSDMTDSEV